MIYGEWITDEVPDTDCFVIVSVHDETELPPMDYTTYGWYHKGDWIVQDCLCEDVVAWMPFPEPYL